MIHDLHFNDQLVKAKLGEEVWKHQQETSGIKWSFKCQFSWSNEWKCSASLVL